METEYERSRVERAKRDLYDPDRTKEEYRPASLSEGQYEVNNDWVERTPVIQPVEEKEEQPLLVFIMKTMMVIAIIAVVGALGFVGYTFLDPYAKPSGEHIAIDVDLPAAVSSGAVSPVRVSVTNNNRTALEYATLSVVYPNGAKLGSTPAQDLKEEKKLLGKIDAEQVAIYDQKAIFLGEENADQEIRFILEYRFAGINSIFTKEEKRPVRISSSPVNLTVNTLKEINSGQTLNIEILVSSNTVVPLDNVVAKIEYPQGFQFIDADPKPTTGQDAWRIGKLNPGDKKKIRLRGVISADDGGERVFHTTVGVAGTRLEQELTSLYSSVLSSVAIRESFIGVNLLIDDVQSDTAVTNFGRKVRGVIEWKNNLDARVANAEIEVRIKGAALNRSSVAPENGGFFRSTDDTVFWDERGEPDLAVLDAGESGSVGFTFLPLPPVNVSGEALKNPTITMEIAVRGKRVSESGVPEEIKSIAMRSVRVTSDVQFASKAVYSFGPFANRGPIPPQVDKETTYTVVWSIVNSSNDIANAVVRAVIPPNVRFTGTVSPVKEDIVYNETTKEMIWNVGSIPAGTGVSRTPREVYFQMAVTPSLSQVQNIAPILNTQSFSAQDAFTGQAIEKQASPVDTSLRSDPKYTQLDGLVVP